MVDIPLVPLGVATLVLLVALSAFFSSSETAIFSLPLEFFTNSEGADDDRATLLGAMRDDPHRLLVTLLVGNNVVNVAISSIVTALLVESFSTGVAVALATVVASAVVLVFGEIVPKSFGLGNASRWALTVARPLRLVQRLLFPLVVVFDRATRPLSELFGGDTAIEEPYVDE